ncbi:9038_t:CDS:2, partial [Funneliformis caledonium]
PAEINIITNKEALNSLKKLKRKRKANNADKQTQSDPSDQVLALVPADEVTYSAPAKRQYNRKRKPTNKGKKKVYEQESVPTRNRDNSSSSIEELRTIWCLVNGDPLADAFPVDILDSRTIGHLKDAIRKNINAPDNVKAKNLEIWKVNIPFDEAEENAITLDNIEVKRKLLIPAIKIYNVIDEIPESNVQFIVKIPAATEDYVPSKLESNDVVFKRQKLLHEKDENIQEICKMPCPSTSACPRKWEKCNQNPLKIFNLRPPECSGPPVSLFHPVFGQFLVDYRNYVLNVPAKRYTQVLEFCNIVGQIYQNEGGRQNALRPFFTSLFDGIQPVSIATDNGSIDDDVLLTDNKVFGEKAVSILWEYKNEIGTGGKDPSIQGGCGHAKYWAQLQTVKIRNNSCCPSIILAIAGPWICVLGAVYLEKPVVEPLTDFILMMNRPEDDGKRVEELAAEAEKIQRFFPYRNHYQVDENEVKFTYLYKFTEESTNLTWKAENDKGKIVIVKFTKNDNHHLPDENILYADDESYKGWRIVISEFKVATQSSKSLARKHGDSEENTRRIIPRGRMHRTNK